jgi:hypothetical protein
MTPKTCPQMGAINHRRAAERMLWASIHPHMPPKVGGTRWLGRLAHTTAPAQTPLCVWVCAVCVGLCQHCCCSTPTAPAWMVSWPRPFWGMPSRLGWSAGSGSGCAKLWNPLPLSWLAGCECACASKGPPLWWAIHGWSSLAGGLAPPQFDHGLSTGPLRCGRLGLASPLDGLAGVLRQAGQPPQNQGTRPPHSPTPHRPNAPKSTSRTHHTLPQPPTQKYSRWYAGSQNQTPTPILQSTGCCLPFEAPPTHTHPPAFISPTEWVEGPKGCPAAIVRAALAHSPHQRGPSTKNFTFFWSF